MKTPVTPIWVPTLVLAMAWLPCGLAQNETDRPLTSASGAAPVVIPPRPAIEPAPRALSSPLELPSPAVIAVTNDAPFKDRRPLSKIRLSPWATEIVKLAEARISDDVLFSFIDNSGTFNLGADQIVYLSDLGISSQIISAMLQHDQDLISGARPLTVASEPAWEPALPTPIAVKSEGLVKTGSEMAPVPALPVPATAGLAAAPVARSPSEINPGVPNVELAALPATKVDEPALARPPALGAQRKPSARKKSPYPVREPQAVELTAPIIFIEGEDRPANTIIIVGFPRTEPPAP